MVEVNEERPSTLFEAGIWIAVQELMDGKVSMTDGVAHIAQALKWAELYNGGQLDPDMKYPRIGEEVQW